jgi:hypothetical protein
MLYANSPVEISIPRGGMVHIRDDESVTLRVLEGTLWITRDRDINDIVLEAGDSLTVECWRATLVSALKSARVILSPAFFGERLWCDLQRRSNPWVDGYWLARRPELLSI